MKSGKASQIKKALLHTLILSLSFIVAWQVTAHAATTVTFGDNTGDDFAGTVEDTHLGFYQSQGNAIWVSMPFINSTTNPYSEAISGWGNIPLAAEYTKTNLIRILENYGGDPSAVFVTGFSRGAIACSYIALRDQAMADIWAGFLPHGQHDGGSYTPDPGNVRLGRIAGRPSIITYGDNDDGLHFNK